MATKDLRFMRCATEAVGLPLPPTNLPSWRYAEPRCSSSRTMRIITPTWWFLKNYLRGPTLTADKIYDQQEFDRWWPANEELSTGQAVIIDLRRWGKTVETGFALLWLRNVLPAEETKVQLGWLLKDFSYRASITYDTLAWHGDTKDWHGIGCSW